MGIFNAAGYRRSSQLHREPKVYLEELRQLARKNGMKSMFEDGLTKVGQGNTTIEEVLRVIRE